MASAEVLSAPLPPPHAYWSPADSMGGATAPDDTLDATGSGDDDDDEEREEAEEEEEEGEEGAGEEQTNSLLSPLHSLSPPSSPSLSEAATDASPARVSYLHSLLKRFPCPTRSNVDSLLSRVLESAAHHSARSLVNALLLPDSPWLPSLYALCSQLEAEADVSGLQRLFALLVALVNLHSTELLSLLLNAQHALHSLTVLEYDPAIVQHLASSGQLRLPLRRHWQAMRDSHCLQLHASGVGAEESVGGCLHALHRLEYAKDVVLLAHVDDATAATLSQLCTHQRVQAVQEVQRDTTVHQLARALHVQADSMQRALERHTADATRQESINAGPRGSARQDGHEGQYGADACSVCVAGGQSQHTDDSDTHPRLTSGCCVCLLMSVPRLFSVSCRCAPARLLLLDDAEAATAEGEEDSTRPSQLSAQPTASPRLRLFHRSAAALRPPLALLNSLLLMARTLTPSTRVSFVESVIEHDCIDSTTRILHTLCAVARLDSSRLVRRVCEWLLPAVVSLLAALLSSCPDSFRSYVVESHALHSPIHSSASNGGGGRGGSGSGSSLLDTLLAALCDPAVCGGSSAGGAVVAFLRQLCDGEEDDSSGEHVAQLQRLCMDGAGMAALADSLARFSLHPRPATVQAGAVCALEWLHFVAGKFKAVAVSRYASTHQLPRTCATFLSRARAQPSPNSHVNCPLLAAPNAVLCGVLRLASCLVRCHRPVLVEALVEARLLDAVLQSTLSPAYLLLHSTSLLSSASLELLSELSHVIHVATLRAGLLRLQDELRRIAHLPAVGQLLHKCAAYSAQQPPQQPRQQPHVREQRYGQFDSGGDSGGGGGIGSASSAHNGSRAERSRKKRKKSSEWAGVDSDRSGVDSSSRRPPHNGDDFALPTTRGQRTEAESRMQHGSGLSGAALDSSRIHNSSLLISPDYFDDDEDDAAVDSLHEQRSSLVPVPLPSPPPDSEQSALSLPPAAFSSDAFECAASRLASARRDARAAEEQRADLLANIRRRTAATAADTTHAAPHSHSQQPHTHTAARTPSSLARRPAISFALKGAVAVRSPAQASGSAGSGGGSSSGGFADGEERLPTAGSVSQQPVALSSTRLATRCDLNERSDIER